MTDINDVSHTSTLMGFEDAVTAQLRAQLASAREALEFIADGYENHNINHVDYRVRVYQVATEALEGMPK